MRFLNLEDDVLRGDPVLFFQGLYQNLVCIRQVLGDIVFYRVDFFITCEFCFLIDLETFFFYFLYYGCFYI